MNEIRKCPNYAPYATDSNGNVFSYYKCLGSTKGWVIDYNSPPRKLKRSLIKVKNKSQKKLVIYGNHKILLVHRLVADAWVPNPNPENYKIVCHLNDIATDPRACNLMWGTNKINAKQRKENQIKDIKIADLEAKLKKYIDMYGEIA